MGNVRRYEDLHRRIRGYKSVDIQADATKFLKAHMFTERLRKYQLTLTMQEYTDIRKQALDGDIQGAEAKLKDIIGNKAIRGRAVL